jgi:2-polyprenyl-6-methoxyphenol hydroxylase-like FAD-dependent oxidoreductase
VDPDYDVIVVGARIAGSVLASLLSQRGHRVLVLDRSRFPSDSLSTHFFRWPALRAFQQSAVFDEVQAAAPHLVEMYNHLDGHSFSEPVEGKYDLNYFMCVRRITLDWILIQRLQRISGVEVREGARVEALIRDDDRVMGVVFVDERGRHSATARVVVGADGFYSQVARLVGAPYENYQDVKRAMYYTYFRGLDPLPGPAAEHHFRGNHLVYVFPTDGDLTLTAATVPLSDFGEFKHSPDERLMAELESLPDLAPRLRRAEQTAPTRGAGNIPCYQRVPYGPGWALVGDAAQVMDPWSGQGIDHASTHATMLAGALADWLDGKNPWEVALGAYHAERNAWSKKTFRRTSEYAEDLRPMTRAALARRGLDPEA